MKLVDDVWFCVGPRVVIFSTPQHVGLSDKLVPEYDYYGYALYPNARGVTIGAVEGEL